ncbi:hypothetical protein TSUD_355920 [Trifolium subterraneum]|uniref:RNase H type-1 domain-containing protein n=1 Tax=Trifolium subterraneum TaxID=3900 RepID=A0A2Z6M3L7_TRISU|nr:hypothetical protein TSUD_355920 [Trifolium subterraneum]
MLRIVNHGEVEAAKEWLGDGAFKGRDESGAVCGGVIRELWGVPGGSSYARILGFDTIEFHVDSMTVAQVILTTFTKFEAC